ncbi:MAG TPA: efflux RND transporter periplasmic adaptor subunit [Methylotenera sp.]|nr:efflux RND transporter periplasmic adaptor subunit [Methylotenera sp.]
MKRSNVIIIGVILTLLAISAWVFWQKNSKAPVSQNMQMADVNGVVQDDSGKTVKYWYDPMVPGQKFDKPGKSPFMDMQLEPKYAETGGGDEGGVSISSQTAQNLGIRLEKVETRSFGESFSAVGRIEPDERRFYSVQTRVTGFVERLYVRAVGDPVSKGQKIAEIYAPELLAAQQEYLTLTSLAQVDADGTLKQAARSRLKLLGMAEGEITAITKAGKPSPRFGVYAPASGVLTELGVREGGQLMSGSSLMQISDLSKVWLIAEVPERDAARLKPGIEADVRLQSLPSETFKGRVSYLYPMLNDTSRTLQVRIELSNMDNQLRPGMYANVAFSGQTHEGLSVSTESIIATGKRKIVIVKEGDLKEGYLKEANGYRPVEVTTGQERDSHTEILSGLSLGENVVSSGQFLIDSEASLSGVLARLSNQNHAQQDMDKKMPASQSEKMPKGRGRVVDVDAKSGKVTLNHEPIAALGWPSMTMGFKVKESKQLEKLKAGDEVEFDLKADEPTNPDLPVQYMIEHVEKTSANKDSMKEVKP